MPKNTTGGNKAKKRANKNAALREILYEPADDQFIGLVTKYLGRGKCEMSYIGPFKDINGNTTIKQIDVRGSVRGGARKWIRTLSRGQLVLISTREFEKGVVDILTLYNQDHINRLKRLNLIDPKIINLMNSLDTDKIKERDDDDGDGAKERIDFSYGQDEAIPSDKKKRVKNVTDYEDICLIPDDYDGDGSDGEQNDPL